MIRQVSSTPSCRVKRVASPTIAAWRSTSYGVAPRRPGRELHVELDAEAPGESARRAARIARRPVVGSSLTTTWFGSEDASPKPIRGGLEHDPDLGLGDREALSRADEERHARPAPVLDLEAERGVRLGRRVGGDAVDPEIALVLPADVVRGVRLQHGAEQRDLRVLDRRGVAAGRRLHRRGGHDLHQVVDDDVAQRADGVVEVAAILDAEVLRHRDLDALDVVAIPDRLEDPVREPEEEDLLEAHLPQVVVDAEDLRLVDVLVELLGERARGLAVVAERLFDDDPGVRRQAGLGEPLDDPAEEERRDLEVEDRALRAGDRGGDALVGGRVAEVPLHVGEPLGEALEHRLVELLARADDRVACALHELVDRPVVDGDPDDRALEQPALLEPVQRVERHHLGQVTGDPEDHEDVGLLRPVDAGAAAGIAALVTSSSSRPCPGTAARGCRGPVGHRLAFTSDSYVIRPRAGA